MLSKDIMNIQLISAKIGTAVETCMQLDNNVESKISLGYKLGHRDARHEAAELAEVLKNTTEIRVSSIDPKIREKIRQRAIWLQQRKRTHVTENPAWEDELILWLNENL